MRYTALICLTILTLITACDDQNETAAPTNTQASSPTTQTLEDTKTDALRGLYCHDATINKTLAIYQKDDSDDLSFGISYWFPNGRNCGTVKATAISSGDNSWIYQKQMSDMQLCELTLSKLENGDIEVRQGGDHCQDLCGAQVEFGITVFPANSLKRPAALDETEYTTELNLCP